MNEIKLEAVRETALEKFGVKLDSSVTQFDVENALALIYDILSMQIACTCPDAVLRKAVVFHIINTIENNPEKDTKTLKRELAAYLRAHGYFPGVKY